MKNIKGKDIAQNMLFVGKKIQICNHFCDRKPRQTTFYKWYSYLDHKFLKEMCEPCALRESWGYNYKQTKNYKKWIE